MDKIHLLYPAVETKKPLDWEIVQKKHKITKPYILTVGKLEPRKNLKRLLEAFQKTGITDLHFAHTNNRVRTVFPFQKNKTGTKANSYRKCCIVWFNNRDA
jgi:hypothetical protein